MTVNAVVSGQAGVALLVNGAELASIHAGRSGEIVWRSPAEACFLLGDAGDLQFLDDIEVDEVIRRLELASTQMDTFHTALILLDGSLPPETRQIAAEELQDFLEDETLAFFVESVLFAHPLTRDSDLPGALAVCTGRAEQTRSFLHRLASLQGAITEVHRAWEGIATPVFGTAENRKEARSMAIREGLFRDLVLCRATHASIDQFLAEALLRSKMRGCKEILLAWTTPQTRATDSGPPWLRPRGLGDGAVIAGSKVGALIGGAGIGARGGAALIGGAGISGAGISGAAFGYVVGGLVGAAIGAAVGGLLGGFASKGPAESVNPTEEDTFWSIAFKDRPYAQGRSYAELRPAYRYGWEARTRYADRHWNDVEKDLQKDWSTRQGGSTDLGWNTAKPAAYDAWNRVESRHRFNNEEDPYWQESYKTRPYAQNRQYEDLSPAYRYGWESGRSLGREGRFEDHENALERGWEKAKGKTQMAWHEAKDAVRDSWDRATNRWDDNEDRYWRESYSTRPYASGRTYDDLRPAYRYGYESALHYQGRQWNDVESDLRSTWDRHSTRSKWEEVKDAVRDAWDRGTSRASNALNRDTTGTYSPAAGTTLGTNLGTETSGVSTGGNYLAGTGYNTTVPTATDMIGDATEGTQIIHDPVPNRSRKL